MKEENLKKRKSLRYAYELRKDMMEQTVGKSRTVPGEAVEVKDLIRRMNEGTLQPDVKQAAYGEDPVHEDFDMSKIQDMDPAERDELVEDLTEIVEGLRGEFEAIKKKAKEEREKPKGKDDGGVKEDDPGG